MSYRFNLSFHEMVVQFSLAGWFDSFLELPAIGFKERNTDVRYGTPTEY